MTTDTTTAKHTPGPWMATLCHGNDSALIKDAVGHAVAETAYQETTAQENANARLIAAAPELLEAVTMLTGLLIEQGVPESIWPGATECINLGLDAARKATGQD